MDVTLIPEETSSTIDLLNRQEFIDRILQVAGALSQNKKNACYAVNGAWGTGKSFVMDMFEKQAKVVGQERTTLSRYLVFHYNCWEYDYYEEPLIAIVITMLDAIDKSVNLIDDATKTKVKDVLKSVAKGLGKKAVATIEEKTGIEIQKAIDIVSDGLQNAEKELQNDFDPYRDFKHALHQLQDEVTSLAKEQTVIFVVDELDRCLPEYAIKVLERLHHLFNGISNVQVILSIDKKQLEHTVRQIYGPETDVNKYLGKFINFELDLPTGSFEDQSKLKAKFDGYFCQFECKYSETEENDVDEFCRIIFDEIDIRSRIALLNKCLMIHNILTNDGEKSDYSIMCIEIFLSVAFYLGIEIHNTRSAINDSQVRFTVPSNDKFSHYVLEQLSTKYQKTRYINETRDDFGEHCLVRGNSMWGILLSAYCVILGKKRVELITDYRYGKLSYDSQTITDYATKYWSIIQLIN